jgi:membrane protein
LHGLIASQVASTAAGGARWIVFLVMIPAVLYATATLYRAVAKVHAIAWLGSGRGIRTSANGVALLAAALLAQLVAAGIVGWIRRGDQIGGAAALLVFLVLGGGTWLALSTQLPHRHVPWTALLPGAITVGVGLLFINVFNIYVTTRLVEGRADTYGALGVAAALLFSLVLVGRLVVVSAELNVSLADRRASHG